VCTGPGAYALNIKLAQSSSVKACLSSQRCCVLEQASTVQLTFSSSYAAVLGPPPLAGPPMVQWSEAWARLLVGGAKGGREAELKELIALQHSVVTRALRSKGFSQGHLPAAAASCPPHGAGRLSSPHWPATLPRLTLALPPAPA